MANKTSFESSYLPQSKSKGVPELQSHTFSFNSNNSVAQENVAQGNLN